MLIEQAIQAAEAGNFMEMFRIMERFSPQEKAQISVNQAIKAAEEKNFRKMLRIMKLFSPHEVSLVHQALGAKEREYKVDYYSMIENGLSPAEFKCWRTLDGTSRARAFLNAKADRYGYENLSKYDVADLRATDY